MLKIQLFIVSVFLLISGLFAQMKTDSLYQLAKTTTNDSLKIKLYFDLNKYYRNIQLDTALMLIEEGLEVAGQMRSFEYLTQGNILIGITYEMRSEYDSAIVRLERALNYCKDSTFDRYKASASLSLGLVLEKRYKYNEAVQHYYTALRLFEKLGIEQGVAMTLNNLGVVFKNLHQFDKAIEVYKQADEIYKRNNVSKGRSFILNNIAGILYEQKRHKEAIPYLKEAIELDKKFQQNRALTRAYTNLGDIYVVLKNYSEAEKAFRHALETIQNLGEQEMLLSIYIGLGFLNYENGEYRKAKTYLTKALEIGKKHKLLKGQLNAYELMAKVEKSLNNYVSAYNYLENYSQLNDSLNLNENSKRIAMMEAQYQNEKKELMLENLRKENDLNQLEIASKNQKAKVQRLLSLVSFLVICILSVLLFLLRKAYRQIMHSKEKLDRQNAEIIQKNEEITAQRDEIEAQRDEIGNQRDRVMHQKEMMKDSIVYAKYIQEAVLTSTEQFKNSFSDFFIFYQPKDVVSGDFYWMTQSNGKTILVVADCTGHGVPGAFMSMLGISLLNELFRNDFKGNAAEALNLLREMVINALKQNTDKRAQKDGMEMGILIRDNQTNLCHWAGANQPLWLLKSQGSKIQDFKPDVMPVGVSYKMNSFENHAFSLNSGDRLYFFSDGIIDQHGGKSNSKFQKKALKKLIESNPECSMKEQGTLIEKAYFEWAQATSKDFDQTDDVTVVGIQL